MAVGYSEADTFPKWLLHHAQARGERPAYREKSRGIWHTTTWRELADEAAALAAALSEQGLQRGAHVALIGDNRPRLYAAMCAVQWLGAVAVPLYQDATAEELVSALQKAEATHVFAENQEQVDKLLEILPRCLSIRCVVYDDDRGMRHYKQPVLVSYDTLLKQGRELATAKREALDAEAARGKAEDVAFLFFTAGTTGPAKGVVLTHSALIDRARVAAAAEGLTDADVAMAYLPPAWIGQNLFGYVQPLVVGYCVCCPESSETMLADMREIGPTYFLATPRVLDALLAQVSLRIEDTGGVNLWLYRRGMSMARRLGQGMQAAGGASLGNRLASTLYSALICGPLRDVLGVSRVRAAYTAGDAIAPDLMLFFRGLGVNLKQLYGSTETGFLVTAQRNGAIRFDSVGIAVPGVELKLTPQREILVRSPGLFKEYHGDPEATSKAVSDGWFHTGDAGSIDESGHLRIIDRMKYVGALKDGTLYAPKLIENRLKASRYIREAVVSGDGRDAVCALIDIDGAAVGRWADTQQMSYTGHSDLASRDEVHALIAGAIAEANAALAGDADLAKAQIRRFAILPKELDADAELLTRTGKLRREAIAERYREVVDAMYDGRSVVHFDAGGDHSDVTTGEIKIRDVEVASSSQSRKAA